MGCTWGGVGCLVWLQVHRHQLNLLHASSGTFETLSPCLEQCLEQSQKSLRGVRRMHGAGPQTSGRRQLNCFSHLEAAQVKDAQDLLPAR